MRRGLIALAALAAIGTAAALNWPPYEIYPYVAEATDKPPLNYAKICEPGDVGEAKASYVMLGFSYPRTYQAVSGDYDGDLVVPAYINGLPVRKVNEGAFLLCTRLRSIRFPSTLREVGENAFAWCTSLTNVTFEEGVESIGPQAFSNCISLVSVRLPKSLNRLGTGVFARCNSLEDVYFEGSAPQLDDEASSVVPYLGEKWFDSGAPFHRVRLHAYSDTVGWIAPYVQGVPEKWPVSRGYLAAYPMVAETPSSPTITPQGLVAVVGEISDSPVAVPDTWPSRYPRYAQCFGTDFTKSLTLPSGKVDASGRALKVYQDYVAGTDPTDPTDQFRATIEMNAGVPSVRWTPNLSDRTYRVYGKRRLWDDWTLLSGDLGDYGFFKVEVSK